MRYVCVLLSRFDGARSFCSFLEVQIDGLFAGGKISCSLNTFLEVADPIPSLE